MSRMISLFSQEFTRVRKRTNSLQKVVFFKFSEFGEFSSWKLNRKHLLLQIQKFIHLDFTDFTSILKCSAVNLFDEVKSVYCGFIALLLQHTVISMDSHRSMCMLETSNHAHSYTMVIYGYTDEYTVC